MTEVSESTGHSLLKRVVVGVIFVPLLVWVFWNGGYPLFIFLAFLTSFGQWELYRMFAHRLWFPHRIVGFISGMLIIVAAFFGYTAYISGFVVLSFVCSFIIEIISGKGHKLETVAMSLLVTVYPALFITFLIGIGGLRYNLNFAAGRYVLLYIMIVIWTFDTMCYFTGRLWGKHPFFHGISPKKTLEGFFGGIICVMILAVAAGIFMGNSYFIHVLAVSVLAALAGQVGDLSESLIKRDRGVKDSSNIIPGHGGILDRFDSLFFAGPVVYAYLKFVLQVSGGHS